MNYCKIACTSYNCIFFFFYLCNVNHISQSPCAGYHSAVSARLRLTYTSVLLWLGNNFLLLKTCNYTRGTKRLTAVLRKTIVTSYGVNLHRNLKCNRKENVHNNIIYIHIILN